MSYVSPKTHAWTYDRVAFKASHNSYDRDERPIITQLSWSAANHYQKGCRGLELDIHPSENLWVWSVNHIGRYKGLVDMQFSGYLTLLRDWSDKNPGHDVITVTVDLKSDPSDLRSFPWQLDAYIKRHLGSAKLFTPGELQGSNADLVSGAMSRGWPTLGDLKGRFILCLSGSEDAKKAYARSGKERLCFADKKVGQGDSRPSTTKGHRVFFNFDLRAWLGWKKTLQWFANQKGFATRGYVINDGVLWKKARSAKVNILATDKVMKYSWATVGPTPFVRF